MSKEFIQLQRGLRATIAASFCFAAWAHAQAPAAPAPSAPRADAAVVEQGRQVAVAADCASCHSQSGGKPFAGGAALNSVFGKLYAPNITPDDKTGIGSWTQADFERALRQGVGKDGKPLYPAMPYDHYTLMSDADIASLWAYMRTVAPAQQTAPANTLPFPLNVRSTLRVWQAAFFKPGRYAPAADKDAAWNRGAYLVEALGHCGACHTPRNIAQASRSDRHLDGAKVEGWYAPDIGNDPLSALSGYSVDSLQRFLKTGSTPHNGAAVGQMGQVVHESLSQLPDADLHAMAVYLKDQPRPAREQRAATGRVDAARYASGKAAYEANCSHCHGADGRGVKGSVPALAGNGAVTAREPSNVVSAMLEGFEPNGTWGAMASFADVLTDQQIADIANYVRSSWGNKPQRDATPLAVGRLRNLAQPSAQAGEAVLQCPPLDGDAMKPALAAGDAGLVQAGREPAALDKLVRSYRTQRPQASTPQVIEALSSAYCRAVVSSGASSAIVSTRVAEFSQQVAARLLDAPGARSGQSARTP